MTAKKQRAIVIGCGGIGKFLIPPLVRFMAYDQKNDWTLVLVDGDEYTVGNANRQAFSKLGNKAVVTAEELLADVHLKDRLQIETVPQYVTDGTVHVHDDQEEPILVQQLIHENDWVFLAVDNHATRLMVSRHCQTLKNVKLFSGGNDLTDGNAQFYARRNGKDLFPPIEEYHPEIAQPSDEAPFSLSCEEMAEAGQPQVIFANMGAAWLMATMFYAELKRNLRAEEVYFDLHASLGGVQGPAAKPILRQKKGGKK